MLKKDGMTSSKRAKVGVHMTHSLLKVKGGSARVLKNSLVTSFIGPFSYENLSGRGTFSTPSVGQEAEGVELARSRRGDVVKVVLEWL
jgi:phosphopantothenoylcysteine synthetase/decarboxylase